MFFSAPNRYLRSRLAYSFLTLSPWHTALTLFLAVLSVCSFWGNFRQFSEAEFCSVFIADLLIAPLIVWCIYAWHRWIPRHVTIPKKAHGGVPEHLGGRVMLMAESLLDVKGCPVLAYNCNNYVGGQSSPGGKEANLMAQFMGKYFHGNASAFTYDFSLFRECYYDRNTRLYGADGKELRKEDYAEPREYHPGMVAEKSDKPDLPRGSVLAICLRPTKGEADMPPYAFFLATTWVEIGERRPQTDLTTLFTSLVALWKATDVVLDGTSLPICLPCLGSGSGHLQDGAYSSIWAIVGSYRAAYRVNVPDHGMCLCIRPEQLRRYDLREVLKLMTFALCNA